MLPAEGRLQLSWRPPLVTGERADLTYSVTCQNCDETVRFEPAAVDLTEPSVVVAELQSHLNYTFTVESHSGVSQFGSQRPAASITASLDYTGELGPVPSIRWRIQSSARCQVEEGPKLQGTPRKNLPYLAVCFRP